MSFFAKPGNRSRESYLGNGGMTECRSRMAGGTTHGQGPYSLSCVWQSRKTNASINDINYLTSYFLFDEMRVELTVTTAPSGVILVNGCQC